MMVATMACSQLLCSAVVKPKSVNGESQCDVGIGF